MSVNLTDVQTDLAYLLGEQSAPSTSNSDYVVRQTFIQRALERAYRAYPFGFNRLTATVPLVSGVATLASAVMQDSILDVREVVSGTNNDNVFERVTNADSDNYSQGDFKYWLTGYQGALLLNSSEADRTLAYRYTSGAPILNASISTPFPSSMALARGALIYYRQAEDPQADIGQEEALFTGEVQEIISQYNRSRPQRKITTRNLDIPEL
jgi:hypothetical protein